MAHSPGKSTTANAAASDSWETRFRVAGRSGGVTPCALFLREAFVQRPLHLLFERRLYLRHVLRRGDGERLELAVLLVRFRRQAGAHAVAQAILHPDARRQPRIEKSAAQHVVADHQRRIVRILVADMQPRPAMNTAFFLSGVSIFLFTGATSGSRT